MPAFVSISASSARVTAGSSVTITGVVTSSDGHALRNRAVRLLAHAYGGRWVAVTSARTSAAGQVTVSFQALEANRGLRLVTPNRVPRVHRGAGGRAVHPSPRPRHLVRMALRLPATRAHAGAQTGVTVGG